ncbi:F0F1 ATP synthase subunit delta [Bacillaceae bacterium]
MSGAVAKRYARALFEVANEGGIIDAVESDLALIRKTLEENGDWRKLVMHPHIAKEEKKRLVEKLFGESLTQEVKNFLKLLIDRRREKLLPQMTAEYVRLANEARGIVEAKVTTAKAISEAEKEQLAERFGKLLNKKLRVETAVDPGLLGGVVVRIGDRLYDGSVAGKLSRFAQHVKQSQVR